jgi:hypothetical protein
MALRQNGASPNSATLEKGAKKGWEDPSGQSWGVKQAPLNLLWKGKANPTTVLTGAEEGPSNLWESTRDTKDKIAGASRGKVKPWDCRILELPWNCDLRHSQLGRRRVDIRASNCY